MRVVVDLSRCYRGVPAGATVRRTVQVEAGADPRVTVTDAFDGFGPGETIAWHWLGGAQLAWTFVEGWARLSDGTRALWVGLEGESLAPVRLVRHPGTRGALTLGHTTVLANGTGRCRWIFRAAPAGTWSPPATR